MDAVQENAIGRALGCSVVASVVIYAALWLSFGSPGDAAGMAGRIFAIALVPAIIVGIWSWRSSKSWSLLRFVGLYVLLLAASAIAVLAGFAGHPSP